MNSIQIVEDFDRFVAEIESLPGYRKPMGFGLCRIEPGQSDPAKILFCSFPMINWKKNFGSAAVFQHAAGLTSQTYKGPEIVTSVTTDFLCAALEIFKPFAKDAAGDRHWNIQVVQTLARLANRKESKLSAYRLIFLYDDEPPQSVPAVYLKLLALSSGAAPLRSLNLQGIFSKLENVAWAGQKPFELAYLRQHEIEMKLTGAYPAIDSVDKFPRYLQHIIPDDNTRILDASRVRLGAQLAAGTVVMPGASYVNFNAGTLGVAMVEGRISSSAVVGAMTDIGGGASILGVLSGGNAEPVTIGEKCLLGANSVTGISLGDGCIVDAGVTVLAGTRVVMDIQSFTALTELNPEASLEQVGKPIGATAYEFKAAALSNCRGLHFRVDSLTGGTIVRRSARRIVLNSVLHDANPGA